MFLLLLVFSVLLGAAVVVRVFLESRKNYPPGPFSFPFLGYRGQGRLINHLAHEEFKALGDEYGDLIFFKLFMDQPVVVVRGHDFIKETHHNRAFAGVGQPLMFKEAALYRKLGLIFSDGDNWQQMRRFTVRALHEQGFGRKQRTDNINDELSDVLERLEAAAEQGREVSVRHIFTLAAANSLLQLVVGQKMPRDGQLQHILHLVRRQSEAFSPSYLHLELFPWLRHVAPQLSGFQKLHEDILELISFLNPQIAEHKASLDTASPDEPPRDLVEAFLRRQRSAAPPHKFSDDNLRVLLRDLFVAGMDTASTVMEWVILALVQNPDVQERAAAEVEERIGHDRTPSIDDMPALPYVEAVIEESMRLTPVLPVVQHSTTYGPAQLGGYHIPANCRVFSDLHSVMHDPEFWGDPEVFRPERFLGSDGPRLRERITAFGLGSRHCIGETHARQVLFLSTAGILQRLRLRLSPGQTELKQVQSSLIIRPQEFTFTVQRRK